MSKTVLYERWKSMISRTTLPSNESYHHYGGRGIKVCERWRDFRNFAEDMGPTFSPELELERIDNNLGYSKENCAWKTRKQQQRNKSSNHLVTWHGCTQTVQDWAEMLGLLPNTLIMRLRRGWSVERALTTGARSMPRTVLVWNYRTRRPERRVVPNSLCGQL
jgi:hypothetical protein